MLFPEGHYVFLDLETTGARATADRITEVALIEVLDGDVIERFQTLVNPGISIPPFITSLTGISQDMVNDAPRFEDFAESLLTQISGRILVAHNARFDHGFLKNEFKRLGLSYQSKVLCTVKLSRQLLPDLSSHRLDNLINLYGLHFEHRHRAMDDADMLLQLMSKWSRQFGSNHLNKIIQKQLKTSSLPAHIDKSFIDSIPNEPGVYFFYGDTDALLYVGKSIRLRERIKSHFSSDHSSNKELELSLQVKTISFQLTGGDLGAQLLESYYIKSQRPIYNRQLRKTKNLWYFQLKKDPQGYLVVIIKSGQNFPVDDLDTIFGVFRSRKMAEDKLREMVQEFHLCHRLTGLEKKKSGACFAYQLKKCHGACVGTESMESYNERLIDSLSQWKFKLWPYRQAVIVNEQSKTVSQYHLLDQWCYLGSAETLYDLSKQEIKRHFEYDTYKILNKFFQKKSVTVIPFESGNIDDSAVKNP